MYAIRSYYEEVASDYHSEQPHGKQKTGYGNQKLEPIHHAPP